MMPKLNRAQYPTFISSRVALRLFDALERNLQRDSLKGTLELETELRYFSLLREVKRNLSLESTVPQRIQQHYFAKELVPLVSWFAFRAIGLLKQWQSTAIKRARIRRKVLGDGSEEHSLEVKGPKNDFQRVEVVVPISKAFYEELALFTDGSNVKKQRYEFHGIAGKADIIQLHVDIIEKAGNKNMSKLPNAMKFALLEVEVPHERVVPIVMRGEHTFPVLNACVPIWKQGRKVQKPFSSWHLAHNGLRKRTRNAVEILTKKTAA